MSSTIYNLQQSPQSNNSTFLFPYESTSDKTYQHVNRNLDQNFVCANAFVISSPAKQTRLKFLSIPKQTTALSPADWEAALLPGDLE